MFNGILWILKTGAPWRDLPKEFGPWQPDYTCRCVIVSFRWGKSSYETLPFMKWANDTGTTQGNESGTGRDRLPESGKGLGSPSDLADREPAGVDGQSVSDKSEKPEGQAQEDNPDRSPSKNDPVTGGKAGKRSDRGRDIQPDHGSAKRPGNNKPGFGTDARRNSESHSGLESEPARSDNVNGPV